MEPIRIEKHEICLNVLEDCQEVTFVMKGSVQIGFEINREIYYVLSMECGSYKNTYTAGNIIGDYYATFNIRSNNVYQTGAVCEGY